MTVLDLLPEAERERRLRFGALTQDVRFMEVEVLGAAERLADEYSTGAVARLKTAVKCLRGARAALLEFSQQGGK